MSARPCLLVTYAARSAKKASAIVLSNGSSGSGASSNPNTQLRITFMEVSDW